MSGETELSAIPDSNPQPASWRSKNALGLAAVAGIALALVIGTSCLACIEIAHGRSLPLGIVVGWAFCMFGPFCTVAAAAVAAIITRQWTWQGACVVILFLPASLYWIGAFFYLFLRAVMDWGP